MTDGKQIEGRISPHFSAAKLADPTIDDVIDVFEDRVLSWLLEPARHVLGSEFGDAASASLLLTYFESIWIYETGESSKDRSRSFFRSAFVEVFRQTGTPSDFLRRTADVLYEDARCGFFHDGLFRGRIFFRRDSGKCLEVTVPKLQGEPDPNGEIQSILIDAAAFVAEVEKHFGQFVGRLRDPKETDRRARFFEICRTMWDWEGEPVVIGIEPSQGQGE